MRERVKRELEQIRARYRDLEVDPELRWFIVPSWPLPSGWNQPVTRVLVLIPPGYPQTPPDNFYTDATLLLASTVDPGSSSIASPKPNENWRQFSYHIEQGDWHPEQGHTLETFALGVDRRLAEAS